MKWIECIDSSVDLVVGADHIDTLRIEPRGKKFALVAWTTYSGNKLDIVANAPLVACVNARAKILRDTESCQGKQASLD